MSIRLLLTVFTTVFLAELGDKTQLATLLFAADHETGKLTVFLGASLALLLSSALAIWAGAVLTRNISERHLHVLAGFGFIVIGIWTMATA